MVLVHDKASSYKNEHPLRKHCPPYFFPYIHSSVLTFSSIYFTYFIIAVPMPKCSGEHSWTSFTLPIEVLNCTCTSGGENLIVIILAEVLPVNT